MPLGAFRLNTLANAFAEDVSTRTAVTVTAYGDAQVDTAQSQFGGASAYFDGANDYLLCGQAVVPSTDDFTVEYWIRFDNISARRDFLSQYTGGVNGRFTMNIQTDGRFQAFIGGTGAPGVLGASAGTITTNTWYHIAFVRSGTNFYLFVDGTLEDTGTGTVGVEQTDTMIGQRNDGSGDLPGYIDELRISNTARYTTSFTPSTEPFTNDANTLLLLHMDGTDGSTTFTDDTGSDRSRVGVSASGDVEIDTALSKFGGASALFPGTNGMLTVDSSANPSGTGAYTIEFWIYRTDVDRYGAIYDARTASTDTAILIRYDDRGGTNNLLVYVNGSTVLGGSNTNDNIPVSTWTHVAVVRETDGTMRLFIGGTQTDTGSDSTNLSVQSGYFGITSFNNNNHFEGSLDEIRISNIARYTTGFTPPTSAFTNDEDTLLLLHMDGTDGSTTFEDDNG